MASETSNQCVGIMMLLLLMMLLPQPTLLKNVQPKKGLETSPLTEVDVVEGGRVMLPCDVNPPISSDDTILVLFYRGSYGTPIYSVDGRDGPVRDGQHWADKNALQNRGSLQVSGQEQGLVLEPVRSSDHDQYRCRVDYRSHPTRNVRVQLNVIVPAESIRVVNEAGLEVSGVIGPYPLNSHLTLQCHVKGGRPPPEVTWWSKTTLIDDVSEDIRNDVTINTIRLASLTRTDLYRVLTCQATNSKLAQPTAMSLTVDMIFPPVSVNIDLPGINLEEGKQYKIMCQTSGSRPKAQVTWYKDGMLMTDSSSQVFHEGNMTRSTLKLTPTLGDHDTYISCRAQNPLLKAQVIEDLLKLDVQYKPRLSLSAGHNLDMDDIKEGDDVYFECAIQANPRVYKVQWFQDGDELVHNASAGIITSNQSLVLQKVSRHASGKYTCSAANLQGQTHSSYVQLTVKFGPSCIGSQKVVYGAGKHEQLNVTCSVESYPLPHSFRWAFNSSSEVIDISNSNIIRIDGDVSQVSYTPRSHHDYGSLLCWAKNTVATQRHPCIFHIIHASPPDAVSNCTVGNISSSGADVKCEAGWDGGLAQTFTLSVTHTRQHTTHTQQARKSPRVLANTSTAPRPEFSLVGLQAGTEYVLTVTGVNKKGQSEPTRLNFHTHKDMAEKHTSPVNGMVGYGTMFGVAGGVMVCVVLICVVMVVIVVLKVRRSHTSPSQVKIMYKDGSNSPKRDTTSDKDDNPDLIPITYEQQLKQVGQTEMCGDDTGDIQLHHLKHTDIQLEGSELMRQQETKDMGKDIQRQQQILHDVQQTQLHHNPITNKSDELFALHRPIIRQLKGRVSVNKPAIDMSAKMYSSTLPHSSQTSDLYSSRLNPHLKSSTLQDPHVSSTPSSPSYLPDESKQNPSLTYGDTRVPLTPTLPMHEPLLPLSLRRQLSISNLPTTSNWRDLSNQSYNNSCIPRHSRAHHRLSLGTSDFSFLDRATNNLASCGRSGSSSTLDVTSKTTDSNVITTTPTTTTTPFSMLRDFNSQRESQV